MNILFLTIGRMESIEERGIYPDLLRYFRDQGDCIYAVSPYERRTGRCTELTEERGAKILHVSIGNITKCGLIEKGISTLRVESKFLAAIKKYFADIKFDLVLYSTPPITFANVIRYIKKRDHAITYLLLKDIFPQNALDLGMLSGGGWKGLIYRYFRAKEKKLYALSDRIGCMSQANADYVLRHNPQLCADKVEVCPNCIEVQDMRLTETERADMRAKYGIPQDKTVFVYGGNLGKPQGIPAIIECLKTQEKNGDCFFLIVGDGTEYGKLEAYVEQAKPDNVRLMKRLPKADYDRLVAACDVGLIFLDHRFTIPNFPSRLLAYMQAGLPVLACTDPNTDIGKVIVDGGFGWWCESNDTDKFKTVITEIREAERKAMGDRALTYLTEHYTAEIGCKIIQNALTPTV
ncbi:MAG: glycosyltransferase family 4 protein [Clostridia bacterium]|nr:glycosyltransferase family 4 protein [Clostridia bacterium]